MADPTEAQLKEAARKALAAGDTAAAKRLVDAARKVGAMAAPAATPTEAPQYAPNGVPMNAAAKAEIMARAKAGTLTPGAASLAGSEAMTAKTEAAMQPSLLETLGTYAGDIGGATTMGLARGSAALAGLPGSMYDLQSAAIEKVGGLLGLDPAALERSAAAVRTAMPGGTLPSAGDIIGAMSEATGGVTDYRGQTLPGQFAGTVAEFVPGAVLLGGLSPGNLMRAAVVPGVASEGAGQLTEGTAWEPAARIAGGLLGPMAVTAGLNIGKRIVSPMGGVDPERLALVDILGKAGVPVTAGQKTGSDWLKRVEAGTSAGAKIADDQAEALTAAALKTAGISAPRATTDVMADAFVSSGQKFENAVSGLSIVPTSSAVTKTAEAIDKFKRIGAAADAPGMFKEIHKAFMRVVRGGAPLKASDLATWRSELSAMTTSSVPAVREVAKDVLRVVDDAIDDAMTAAGRDPKMLNTARAEHRNLLAIAEGMKGKSEAAAVGLLTPEMLPAAVKGQSGKAYVTGKRGEIGDLARAAQGVLRRPSSSGTAENIAAMMRPAALPIGVVGGSAVGGLPGALLGAGAALTPGLMRRATMLPIVQQYLGNQVAGPGASIMPSAADVVARIPGLLAQ